MSKIRVPIGHRPTYYDGQLLLAKDFLAEQEYHVHARQNHNRISWEWGILRGLGVTRAHERAVRVAAGAAFDEHGHDIRLDEPSVIDLSEFRPHDRLHVCLAYEETPAGGKQANRMECFAALTAGHDASGLVLASFTLDDDGKVDEATIDYAQTRYARLVAGSISAEQLHEDLRRGWFRSPFRPAPMVEGPEEGGEEGLPAFRVGATEALSPDPRDAGDRDRGAGGTMAIPIPPSVRHITRFRIAGNENEGEIALELIRGGWDPRTRKHVRDVIVSEKITHKGPYFETYHVGEKNRELNPEHHTLALWLKGSRRTAVSLVAVEFGY